MDIHIFSQVFDTDTGTFNMPAGITNAPWTVPFQFLIIKLGFCKPKYKICFISFIHVLFYVITNSNLKIFFVLRWENIIIVKFRCIKIYIFACDICIPFFQKHLNHMNKFFDTIGSRFYHIRAFNFQFLAVFKKRIGIILCNIHHRFVFSFGTGKHLIFPGVSIAGQMSHICDIHDTLYIISGKTQILFQHIFHNIASEISNMGKMINGRPACIHCHFSRFIGNKLFHFFGKGIV